MWGEERQTQGEVGAGEDGEGLDEDVGDGLVAGEVRVELVSVRRQNVLVSEAVLVLDFAWCVCVQTRVRRVFQLELISNITSAG